MTASPIASRHGSAKPNGTALGSVRICDFTGQLAGAGATKWLAAFGAEVIRIEDPVNHGLWDVLRNMAPFPDERRGPDFGGGFNNHNVEKRGITLNLRTDRGKEILAEIIQKSDVVSENFAAGVLDRWGFGWERGPFQIWDALGFERVVKDARAAGLAYAHIRGSIERYNAFPEDPIQMRGGWAMDIDELYAMADAKPDDMDLLQTYDDYPVISMMQFEDLGFCGKGEGPAFVRERDLTIAGDFRTTRRAVSFQPDRREPPAASSGWSRPSARSPAQPVPPRWKVLEPPWFPASA